MRLPGDEADHAELFLRGPVVAVRHVFVLQDREAVDAVIFLCLALSGIRLQPV